MYHPENKENNIIFYKILAPLANREVPNQFSAFLNTSLNF